MILTLLSRAIFYLAMLLVVATTLFIFLIRLPFDSFYWSELLEAFWFQYGLFYLAAIVLLLIAFVLGRKPLLEKFRSYFILMILSAVGASYILITIQLSMPWWPDGDGERLKPITDKGAIRILQHNAFRYMNDHSRVITMLQNTPADLVALEEVDNNNLASIDRSHLGYPYRAGGSNLGLLLMSKWPIEHSEVVEPYPGFPSLLSTVRLPDGRRLSVVVVHPPHATEPYSFQVQKDVFDSLVKKKAKFKSPLILLGDVNATPFNHALIVFKDKMGLKNPREGMGFLSTWPSYMPWFLRIPIDHILISNDLQAMSLQVLPNTGSDHLPLYLTVK